MALKTPYATEEEANSYLEGKAWEDSDSDVKTNSLFWGMMFLDTNYKVANIDLTATIPDELKYANALAAEDYTLGTLLNTTDGKDPIIKMEKSKAGGVETEIEYLSGYRKNLQSDIDALMASLGASKNSGVVLITRN